MDIPTHIKQRLTAEQAWFYGALPVNIEAGITTILTFENSKGTENVQELEMILNSKIEFKLESRVLIEKELSRHYRHNEAKAREIQQGAEGDLLLNLINESKEYDSSDIHIEIYQSTARVRYRIDGKLQEKYTLSHEVYPSLINKIKIRANLDISEKRLPQDGRIKMGNKRNGLELRVSVLPTLYGEKIVLRLLQNDANHIEVQKIGLNDNQLNSFLEAIKKPEGIILISGPTGSGKTTSLYSLLKTLNTNERNIITVENPVEYTLEGINQVQVNDAIGMTFAGALRSILRQDPDVIMLGEIRDSETAQMAIRAALTGHLVLSTIHTNSAWGTITRLKDMGIPGFLIESTLNLSAAQRLIRTLCPHCKKKVSMKLKPDKYKKIPSTIEEYYEAVGCPKCYFTGYKGRKALFEVIPINEENKKLIRSEDNLVDVPSTYSSHEDLKSAALKVLKSGETSPDEVYPIILTS